MPCAQLKLQFKTLTTNNYGELSPLRNDRRGLFRKGLQRKEEANRPDRGFEVYKKGVVPPADSRDKKQKDLTNFRQEIEIMRSLQHKNVILMLDTFETPEHIILVTEFARGELFEILDQTDETLPEDQIRSIAIQLTSALHYLHSNRVIHRDMKVIH